ncbi:MAG: rubredoxin [Clostridia bacterium]|jgi:rubredoxin|nr:rubredoxin [Clostridia bacterium]
MKYECIVCGHIYDESVEGVKFEDLPEDWVCPLCGVGKDMFKKVEE